MKTHKNHLRLLILLLLVLLACVGYMTVGVHFENQKLFAYAMRIRTPKLIAMLITAFAIGSASIVFQSIINNTIVTPCLLGMDQLYSLIHTAVFFVAGSGSFLAVNANAAFAVDLAIMGAVATVIYSYLFQKTNHNVLYVLLIGTVLTSFFSSIQTTLTRVMDPNEYDTLLTDLVASFSNVNSAILVLSVVVLALVAFAFRKELVLLDVLTLGKDQAINLGVDYAVSAACCWGSHCTLQQPPLWSGRWHFWGLSLPTFPGSSCAPTGTASSSPALFCSVWLF